MEEVGMKKSDKLAVIFPGIGYHKDKPLLYYATKLVQNAGYEVISIEYHDMPQKIRGNIEMMKKAAMLACEQTTEQLSQVAFTDYEDVLFIGKSIGTVALSKYAADRRIKAGQIWYTPVEATFSFAAKEVIAFIGDADPWSDVDEVKKLAKEQKIRLYSYPDCNHSLECEEVDRNLEILRDVMQKTDRYIGGR